MDARAAFQNEHVNQLCERGIQMTKATLRKFMIMLLAATALSGGLGRQGGEHQRPPAERGVAAQGQA